MNGTGQQRHQHTHGPWTCGQDLPHAWQRPGFHLAKNPTGCCLSARLAQEVAMLAHEAVMPHPPAMHCQSCTLEWVLWQCPNLRTNGSLPWPSVEHRAASHFGTFPHLRLGWTFPRLALAWTFPHLVLSWTFAHLTLAWTFPHLALVWTFPHLVLGWSFPHLALAWTFPHLTLGWTFPIWGVAGLLHVAGMAQGAFTPSAAALGSFSLPAETWWFPAAKRPLLEAITGAPASRNKFRSKKGTSTYSALSTNACP